MKKIIIFTIILTCIWGCRTSKNTEKNTIFKTHLDFETVKEQTINKYWKLISIHGVDCEMNEGQPQESFFIMRYDSTFSGFAKCNSFQGNYIIRPGNHILFKNISSTLKFCQYSDKEYQITRLFDNVNSFSVKNDTLYFLKDKTEQLAIFKSIVF